MLITEKYPFLRPRQNDDSDFFEKTLSDAQVLIIEGISGSGKDTLQMYLKKKLKGRDIYAYSEGELLQSWKQLQIEGIFKVRIKFMKAFVSYIKGVIKQDTNAVFLLNRFHLSTFVSTIIQQPKFEKEYDEIINALRSLSVHVFILQLDENEIEERSFHPERSTAWQKLRKQIANKEGFRNTLGRHIWQQELILDAAERQRIPYSVMKLSSPRELGGRWVRVPEAQNTLRRRAGMNGADAKLSRRKRGSSSNVLGSRSTHSLA